MSRGENVTTVPMERCLELLLNVNTGASIQLDGAARLIRKFHNSTLEIHDIRRVRSKISQFAVRVIITLKYLNRPELIILTFDSYFFFVTGNLVTRKIVDKSTSSLLHNKLILWRPFPFLRSICMISDEINSVAISFFSCFLFHQEVCSSKNYRAFGFKLPDKKLISLRRITIFQGWLHVVHQNLLLQFFSNMECDCAADKSSSMQIWYIFRCHHPTWTRCAAAFPFPACMREVHEIFFCAD